MKADYRIPINKLLKQIASRLLLGRDKPACPGQVKITGGQANVKLTCKNWASGYPARLGNHEFKHIIMGEKVICLFDCQKPETKLSLNQLLKPHSLRSSNYMGKRKLGSLHTVINQQ